MNKKILNEKIIILNSNATKIEKQQCFISILSILRQFYNNLNENKNIINETLITLTNNSINLIQNQEDEDFCINLIKKDNFNEIEKDFFHNIYNIITKKIFSNKFINTVFCKNKTKNFEDRKYIFFNLYLSHASNEITKLHILAQLIPFFKNFDIDKINYKFNGNNLESKITFEEEFPKITYDKEEDFFLIIHKMIKKNIIILKNHKTNINTLNYNEEGQKITDKQILKNFILIYSSILFGENYNNNFSFNEIFNCYKYQEHFKKIDFYSKSEKFHLALKESIIFLESSFRDKIFEENLNIKNFKINNYRIETENLKSFLKEKYIDFNNIFFEETVNKHIEEIEKQEDNYQKLSLKEILIILNNNNKISEEDFIFLNYILLNDNNEGMDLRNKLLHGFGNKDDIIKFIYNKEIQGFIIKFIIFYLIFVSFIIINDYKYIYM